MTITCTQPQNPAGADTASVPHPDHSDRPALPEIYRSLSCQIDNLPNFFDSLIMIDDQIDRLDLITSEHPEPIISLIEKPNPIANPNIDPNPTPAPTPESPQQPAPYIMEGSVHSSFLTDDPPTLQELIKRHFESALLQAATNLVTNPHGPFKHWDPNQWDQPSRQAQLMDAAKCVFHAQRFNDTLDEYIEEIEKEVNDSINCRIDERVTVLLTNEDPTRQVHPPWTSRLDPSDITLDPSGITVNSYNKAATILGCSRETQEANRGAIPWILAQGPSSETPAHQGEFIGAERTKALSHGMTPKAWTKMTALDPTVTYTVIRTARNLADSAQTINWLTSLNQPINIPNLMDILQIRDVTQSLAKEPQDLKDSNIRTVVTLALQHSNPINQPQRDRRTANNNISDAHIYLMQMTHNQQPIRSKTWNGLLKAIHRWHEQANQDTIRNRWNELVTANHSYIRAWEPLLQTFEHEGVTATELTDERMLLDEALHMQHCVHLYGAKAQSGQTHIFSLKDQSGTRATVSIIPNGPAWREEQTRGYKNHPTTPELLSCAREILKACNEISPGTHEPGTPQP